MTLSICGSQDGKRQQEGQIISIIFRQHVRNAHTHTHIYPTNNR